MDASQRPAVPLGIHVWRASKAEAQYPPLPSTLNTSIRSTASSRQLAVGCISLGGASMHTFMSSSVPPTPSRSIAADASLPVGARPTVSATATAGIANARVATARGTPYSGTPARPPPVPAQAPSSTMREHSGVFARPVAGTSAGTSTAMPVAVAGSATEARGAPVETVTFIQSLPQSHSSSSSMKAALPPAGGGLLDTVMRMQAIASGQRAVAAQAAVTSGATTRTDGRRKEKAARGVSVQALADHGTQTDDNDATALRAYRVQHASAQAQAQPAFDLHFRSKPYAAISGAGSGQSASTTCLHITEPACTPFHSPFSRVGGGYSDTKRVRKGGPTRPKAGVGSGTGSGPGGLSTDQLLGFMSVFGVELATALHEGTARLVSEALDARLEVSPGRGQLQSAPSSADAALLPLQVPSHAQALHSPPTAAIPPTQGMDGDRGAMAATHTAGRAEVSSQGATATFSRPALQVIESLHTAGTVHSSAGAGGGGVGRGPTTLNVRATITVSKGVAAGGSGSFSGGNSGSVGAGGQRSVDSMDGGDMGSGHPSRPVLVGEGVSVAPPSRGSASTRGAERVQAAGLLAHHHSLAGYAAGTVLEAVIENAMRRPSTSDWEEGASTGYASLARMLRAQA